MKNHTVKHCYVAKTVILGHIVAVTIFDSMEAACNAIESWISADETISVYLISTIPSEVSKYINHQIQ